jgi:hypothetical protein
MNLVDQARAAKASITEKNQTRKRLRGPANLQYAIAYSIALFDKKAWAAITATRHCSCRRL